MSPMDLTALGFWILVLLGGAWAAGTLRHPQMKPLAAYLSFVLAFSAASAVLFWALSYAVLLLAGPATLAEPAAAIPLVLAALVPALLLALWLIRRPPGQTRQPR